MEVEQEDNDEPLPTEITSAENIQMLFLSKRQPAPVGNGKPTSIHATMQWFIMTVFLLVNQGSYHV